MAPGDVTVMHPELKTFIERAIVPALLEQFLREHQQKLPCEPRAPERGCPPAGPHRPVMTEIAETV